MLLFRSNTFMKRLVCLLSIMTGASFLATGEKPPKPGSLYTWTTEKGTITLTVEWDSYENVLRGMLTNSTPLTLTIGRIHLRQYRQPLLGIIVDSPVGQVSNVPPGNTAVYNAIGTKAQLGCSVVIDSVDLFLEDVSGNRGSTKLKADGAEPYWYTGPSCYWEERKYKKSKR
jgi:hypothetical protein